MEKIYNNLNIEKLINTEWFKQFNLYEQEEITWMFPFMLKKNLIGNKCRR